MTGIRSQGAERFGVGRWRVTLWGQGPSGGLDAVALSGGPAKSGRVSLSVDSRVGSFRQSLGRL